MVRAKFQLQEVRHNHYGSGKTLVFRPMYDNSIPEDRRFAKATPSGEFTMYVDNEAALNQLHLGERYYFDITEAPLPETA